MSTLHIGQKTNQRVLPQPAALERSSVENTPGRERNGANAHEHARVPGVQHGRGESHQVSPDEVAVTPAVSAAGDGGVAPTNSRKRAHPQPRVFVLDRKGRPLQPARPDRARKLLKAGRARVVRVVPFTIRIIDRVVEDSVVDGVEVGVDPGSRTTGIAVFTAAEKEGKVTREGVWLGEVEHRSRAISNKLTARASLRRARRSRNLRHRAPRFNNRSPQACDSCGANSQATKRWCRPCQGLPRAQRGSGHRSRRLAPSLAHQVATITAWVSRLARWAPVTAVHVERNRFDTHLLANPAVSGTGYQQGTLAGFEVREYVLTKWAHTCAYCDATGVVLNLDHVVPKSKGGPDRPSNLVAACIGCNQAKGSQTLAVFLADSPARLARITRGLKTPLSDAAAMNTTRYAITDELRALGFPVFASTGGRTKYNRTRSHVPKTHALDALCVGEVEDITTWPQVTTAIKCTGRGSYQRVNPDRYGFARGHRSRKKIHHGFITGDLVRAVVPGGKKAGRHTGRVAVRARGDFNITTATGLATDINHKHIRLIQRGDGYTYNRKETAAN